MATRWIVCSLPVWVLASVAGGEDWTAFRGALGTGVSVEKAAPLKWSSSDNVVWKIDLPMPGNGSPIVTRGKVLVACAEDPKGLKRSLYCFDRRSGQQLWVQTVNFGRETPTHETNPYCGSTPASDGERVVVWHSTAGLYCYGLDGKELWRRDLGEFEHMWGDGASPVLSGDRVLLNTGPGKNVSLLCLSLADGQTLWEHQEPQEGDGQRNADGKYMGSWSTPVVATIRGVKQAICTMSTRVVSCDVDSGKLLWWCEGIRGSRGDLAYSSPMVEGDLVVAVGGFRGPSLAVRVDADGDLTERRLWRRDENPQNIGTGILLDGYCYLCNAGPGTLECLRAEDGKTVWQDRAGANVWGAMVLAGGHLYVTNQRGETRVFKPNAEKLELVATNSVEDSTNATPALSDGQWFLRTNKHLFCIGKK